MIYLELNYKDKHESACLNPNWAERKFSYIFSTKESRNINVIAETDKAIKISNTITEGQWIPKTAISYYK